MKFSIRFLLIAVCFGMPGAVSDVHALTVAGNGPLKEGIYPAGAIVNGNPAIAWTDEDYSTLNYARATDAEGTVWGPPVTVDSGPWVGWGTALLTVNGNPAVFYVETKTDQLKFVRATDPEGTNWGTPVTVRTARPSEREFTVQIVGGVPAVAFVDNGVKFLRANDANGSTWGTATFVSSESYVHSPSLAVVEGFPAIVFASDTDKNLWYERARDPAGTLWNNPPVKISTANTSGSLSLQIVNGRPSIAYTDGSLFYIRASNTTGTLWGSPVRLDAGGGCSLAVINGKPAIGYYLWTANEFGSSENLRYIQAIDSNGATAAMWGPAVTVDTTGPLAGSPDSLTLLEAGGRPALVYRDVPQGSLKYARATNDNPATQWPADLLVLGPAGTVIPDGQTKDFGVVETGSTSVIDFRLKHPNSGGADLNIQSVTIGGPDAAEFSITALTPSTTLPAGASTPLTVKYAPVAPGLKSAVLHIVSNAEGDSSPYDIFLTGVTGPDITVEQPAGTVLSDGGLTVLPLTSAGSTLETVFTVRNPGGTELSGLAITIDGPDAGEFSVVAVPAASLAPVGNTTFTLRHIAVIDGMKSAALHITNNISGSKNPFDIRLHTEPGQPDPSFHPPQLGEMAALAIQADGKILCAAREGFVRLNPDGGFDTTFFPVPLTSLASSKISDLAVQPDGRILIAGNFTKVDGQPHAYLARLNADGSLDPSFDASLANSAGTVAVLPDGRILAGGYFTSSAGAPDVWLARFNPDGSPDPGFKPGLNAGSIPSHYNYVESVALQPDGGILIGGWLGAANLEPAPRVARLTSGGSLEFLSVPFESFVREVSVRENGGFFAGGDFAGGFAQLLPNGTIDPDPSFRAIGRVYNLAQQADGKCLLSGEFIRLRGEPRESVARFNADGSLDTFNPHFNHNVPIATFVSHMAVQRDGKVIVAAGSLVRFVNDPAFSLLTTEGHSIIRWLRGGSSPEVGGVTFEIKPDDSPDWAPPRIATRIPGGWKSSGLTLPAAGSVRARGFNGSSIVESVTEFTVSPSPLDEWRLQHFGTFSNIGVAADNFDLDHDGLNNFTEFAFGLNPMDRASSALPVFVHNGTSFTATFTAPAGTEDVLYSAEWSPTMLQGTWTNVPDTGTGGTHVFSVPAKGARVFVRYVVQMR